MKKKSIKMTVYFILFLSFSFTVNAKEMPLKLLTLINNSELIALVDVFEIKSQGKSMPGHATASIRKILLGNGKSTVINMQWNGISITELGQWIVFLKKGSNGYLASHGTRSFWKVDIAELDKHECCLPFVVLRPPVENLSIESDLISKEFVYINGLPREHNPVKLSGIKINELENYIQRMIKKDK